MRYANIILPVAGGVFTYSVGDDIGVAIAVGSAVEVQFGARKIVGGIVRELHDRKPVFPTKPVRRLLFPWPVVPAEQLRLWDWMAGYYMCSPGEVMRAALPALLKPAGLSEDEFTKDEFRPRTVRFVALALSVSGEEAFNEVCEKLRRRAPKQYDALVEIAGHGGVPVPRAKLRADSAALAALQKKELIVFSEQDAEVFNFQSSTFNFQLPQLSPAQQTAFDGLREKLRHHKAALLFGVPSSGKSEVCFHAMARTLARGRDVLFLLPEIALTTQFVGRVRRIFGDGVVVCHSALSDRRRAETYLRLTRSRGPSLIVGARSAIFLPLPRLGLVVVDEEHDPGYKQHDPAPRYNARDAAMVLAGICDARVILAGATPSLETWANCEAGRYGLVELAERWGGTLPPAVTISDTLRAVKRGERRSHFNKDLLDGISGALSRGEQVILFQNRRGIAPFAECPDCGYVPKCDHCAIPMTVHRGSLRCHYCGAVRELPPLCPACSGMSLTTRGFGSGNGSSDTAGVSRSGSVLRSGGSLVTRGFGTEKIEEELAHLFPSARIARLDRDSAASERAYERIICDFEAGATDILVGTQMVTKGLDFAGVSLVGILNADNLMNHPDFRASERAYSLIAQVAGRAGRHSGRGQVVIQTASPESRLIAQAAAGDYRAMAAELLAERAAYGYPPYARLVSITLRHPERETLDSAARRFGELLRAGNSHSAVLGPQPPVTEKIKGEYALLFLLKSPRSSAMSAVRQSIRATTAALLSDPAFRRVTLTVDVDPV